MDTDKTPTAIRVKRTAAGLSRRELAERVGVSSTQIRRYERGEQSPTLPVARRLADTLGCTLDELAGVS